jgi:hypothetical protein
VERVENPGNTRLLIVQSPGMISDPGMFVPIRVESVEIPMGTPPTTVLIALMELILSGSVKKAVPFSNVVKIYPLEIGRLFASDAVNTRRRVITSVSYVFFVWELIHSLPT